MSDVYYNTNRETGEILAKSKRQVATQEERVTQYFQAHPTGHFTVHHINRIVLPAAPHHSAQRAISNLTDADVLEKTNHMVREKYGKMVHTWRLKPKREVPLFKL